MNFRSRELLDACYQFHCQLRIPGVCDGGLGEPCHANWPEHGKGMSLKAHDCFVVPGCRPCHIAIDQGSQLSGERRKNYWLSAYWRFLPMLWERGLIVMTAEPIARDPRPSRERRRRKQFSTATPSKRYPRNPTRLA